MTDIELKFEDIYMKLPRDRKSITSAKTMLDMLLNQINSEEEEQRKQNSGIKGFAKKFVKGVKDVQNAAYEISKDSPIAQEAREMMNIKKDDKNES